jgi:predicted  nucleic acid-binding Zn-ribbon protein
MATKKQSKQSTATTVAEVGAGIAALAAAAGAGYYFYASDDAKKHRAAASKWAKDMKNDVVKEAKKLKKIDQKTMAAIVDKAAAAYSTARSVNPHELKAAAGELKKHWRSLSDEISGVKDRTTKAVKKAMSRPAAKKAPKKASKAPSKAAKKSTKKASR